MIAKRILLMNLLFILFSNVPAQEVFIYNEKGEKEYFMVNKTVKYAKLTSSAFRKYSSKESGKNMFNKLLSEKDSVMVADELIYIKDGCVQWCFNDILLQTKEETDLNILLNAFKVPYKSFRPYGLAKNEYLVKLSVSEALHFANLLYETGAFQYAVPAFYRANAFQNPYYSSQWGLKNTGQHGGETGMDINVESAWNWSTGEGIVVAVIDNGVQLDHPDLAANLLPGYDALGLGSAGENDNQYSDHGTKCAGVIAAINNDIGVKGVAYNAKIIPIRVGWGDTLLDVALIDAFRFLCGQNVDVVNCSFGSGSPNPMLSNAIDSMVRYGRNGLGTPVICSVGNKDYPFIFYPASLSNTIAVGAMSPCGERKGAKSCDGETNWGSHTGNGLDVVAPGVFIPTTTTNSGYILDFNGTSAACPHAAGVMALILSANPCLTATEARAILCYSCDKLQRYSYCEEKQYGFWNTEVGYGKINAYKAVLEALAFPSSSYQLAGGSVTSVNTQCVFDNDCDVAAGVYYDVQKYTITQNISYPYAEHPVIIAQSNGYSGANPNSSTRYCSVSNITNTSATLKTWVYKLDYNSIGQIFTNTYIPVSPNNVWFKATVYDEPDINLFLNNQNITNTSYNLSKVAYCRRAVQVNY